MTAIRPLRLAALALPLAAILWLAGPVAAETPTPGAPGASPSAGVTAAPSATAPCPNPTPAPAPSLAPGQSPPHTPAPNLCPAELKGSDPTSLFGVLFTPIFQALFLGLVVSYNLLGQDIGLAIIVLTILIRLLLVPLFRAQIVSQRRMQLLQPEITALRQKYKDRQKLSEETMRLYRERGVNPASGCLPGLLQLLLLIPMYSVFSSGLSAPNIDSMLHVFGTRVVEVACQTPGDVFRPCLDTTVSWLGGLDMSKPEIFFMTPFFGFGLSLLALLSAFLQLIQTRMMTPQSNDPSIRAQQRVFLILPLFSIIYGSFLPAGLFVYWIVTTVFSIVQQYLIAGWGALFPLFGWTPSFARDHTPRFPVPQVALPAAGTAGGRAAPPRRDPADRAAGTVRPVKGKGRHNRRGRRR
ncbi:MAG TPA: membrane protein insertase YidC [Candidatus Limnocylindrales bacterium]|nr:membrane protein insertase YidC [Candidatus Limnocylindrales bacterium]